jgi:carbon storage regulator CsrA
MLVLKRSLYERVFITLPDKSEIIITLTEILNNRQIKLGFDAPQTCIILREEVLSKIDREKHEMEREAKLTEERISNRHD